MKPLPRSLLLPVALIGLAIPAQAAVVVSYIDTSNSPTVSNTDLVNGLTPVVVGTASLYTGNQNWNNEGLTGASAVNDGLNPIGASVGMNPGNSRTNTGNAGGIDIIWNFSSAQSIDAINLYFGWTDGGRDNVPVLNIYTSTTAYVLTDGPNPDGQMSTGAVDAGIAANGNFTLLATTVNTAPSSGSNIMASITSDSGPLASNVRSIYVQFGAAENGWVGNREIDVIAAVPEPTSFALLVGSLTSLMVARRRRKA
jgi:hypothetical protein